ncbi:MAG: sensor histidine kinase [Phycisphaerales bacterium]
MPASIGSASSAAHPLRVLLVVLLLVFAVEGAIMFLVPPLLPWPITSTAGSLFDATLLVVVTAPALWVAIVRPLRDLSNARGELLRGLYEVQERERASIGRDLHDEVGQQFTALLVGLRCLADAGSLDEARHLAIDLHAAAASGLEEVRRLARGLRPAVLEAFGLAAAAERLCEDAEASHGLRVESNIGLARDREVGPGASIAAYRILQEALTNAARHSGATHASVGLAERGGVLELTISDDGRGFDPHQAGRSGHSLGIHAMRERARVAGGRCRIDAAPGQGTRIRVTLPLEAA